MEDSNPEFYTITYSVIANAIWFVIGFLAVVLYKIVLDKLPSKRLWGIRNPKNLIICASTSAMTDTGQYIRPSTGIGQLRSLGLIIPSLTTAYKDIRIKNILLSTDQIGNRIENDIILIGGPKTNGKTKDFLERMSDYCPVGQIDNIIHWKKKGFEEFEPILEDNTVKKDFGFIVRTNNPFSPDSNKTSLIILSGGHTYGTIAAARFFIENIYYQIRRFRKTQKNYAKVIQCKVVDGVPVDIKCIKDHSW